MYRLLFVGLYQQVGPPGSMLIHQAEAWPSLMTSEAALLLLALEAGRDIVDLGNRVAQKSFRLRR
jgi:hypothetical protein